MSDSSLPLFDPKKLTSSSPRKALAGKPRIEEPTRTQGELRFAVPDDMVPQDHPARTLWNLLGSLDLTAFGAECESVEGRAGRSF